MKSSQIILRILDAIRESETICVVGHVRPDGDCVGSQLALAMALKSQGKKVECWNQDSMPKKLAFLDTEHLLEQPKPGRKFDLVIATDCASFERLGAVVKPFRSANVSSTSTITRATRAMATSTGSRRGSPRRVN